jgi:hypothetical protein
LNCDLIAGEHAATLPFLRSKKGPKGISKPNSPTKPETAEKFSPNTKKISHIFTHIIDFQ